jgi:hypothetical protein
MTVEFLLFCIATVGMTLIITQGGVFRPFRQFLGDRAERIRERREQEAQERGSVSLPVQSQSLVEWFNELINCAQCTGFWCGLFCGLLLIPLEAWKTLHDFRFVAGAPLPLKFFLLWFCYGLGGSFLASLGSNLIDWIFYRKMNALRQLEEQDMVLAERRGNVEGNT